MFKKINVKFISELIFYLRILVKSLFKKHSFFRKSLLMQKWFFFLFFDFLNEGNFFILILKLQNLSMIILKCRCFYEIIFHSRNFRKNNWYSVLNTFFHFISHKISKNNILFFIIFSNFLKIIWFQRFFNFRLILHCVGG